MTYAEAIEYLHSLQMFGMRLGLEFGMRLGLEPAKRLAGEIGSPHTRLRFGTAQTADKDMQTIGAAKFKENCLRLLDELSPEGLIITKHGKPVARVIPVGRDGADLIGSLGDKIEVHGDLESTGLVWDVAEP